jgi:hypothetical protein
MVNTISISFDRAIAFNLQPFPTSNYRSIFANAIVSFELGESDVSPNFLIERA